MLFLLHFVGIISKSSDFFISFRDLIICCLHCSYYHQLNNYKLLLLYMKINTKDKFMKDGLCILLITPMLAKNVASADLLLLVLHRAQFITLNDQELTQCQSTYTSNAPLTEEKITWRKTSTTHAFPRMTFSEFRAEQLSCHSKRKE